MKNSSSLPSPCVQPRRVVFAGEVIDAAHVRVRAPQRHSAGVHCRIGLAGNPPGRVTPRWGWSKQFSKARVGPQFISFAFDPWKATVIAALTGDRWVTAGGGGAGKPFCFHQKQGQWSHLLLPAGNSLCCSLARPWSLAWILSCFLPFFFFFSAGMDRSDSWFLCLGAGKWKWNGVYNAERPLSGTVDQMYVHTQNAEDPRPGFDQYEPAMLKICWNVCP